MEWYLPITILPGLGLILLSTSNFLISLNSEIIKLKKNTEKFREIIDLKIHQLKRLNWALVGLYAAIFTFLLSGILGVFFSKDNVFPFIVLLGGTMLVLFSSVILIIYSFKSITIRQKHLRT